MADVFANKRDLITRLIAPEDTVLDIGFWGQGKSYGKPNWPHAALRNQAKDLWGIDLEYDESVLSDPAKYRRASAESFDLPIKFDVIFAGDLIEHLSNPGLFLDSVRTHLAPEGRLMLTTPNTFNLFNLTEKISKGEPTVNSDHTCYFNTKTLKQLLTKCGFTVKKFAYIYSLESEFDESWKKRIINLLYRAISWKTPAYLETLVVVAVPKDIAS